MTDDPAQQQLAQITQALNQAHAHPGAEVTVLSNGDRQALQRKAEDLRQQAARLEGQAAS